MQGLRVNSLGNLQQIHAIVRIYLRSILFWSVFSGRPPERLVFYLLPPQAERRSCENFYIFRLEMRRGECYTAKKKGVRGNETDMESGMSTVLVLSGVSTRETLRTYAYRPSIVLDGAGDIAALARAEKRA